jgi:hypothetical protein
MNPLRWNHGIEGRGDGEKTLSAILSPPGGFSHRLSHLPTQPPGSLGFQRRRRRLRILGVQGV